MGPVTEPGSWYALVPGFCPNNVGYGTSMRLDIRILVNLWHDFPEATVLHK